MIVINGRYLTQPLSGVQRYASEMVRALDGWIGEDARLSAHRWMILAPPGSPPPAGLGRIGFDTVGRSGGHVWEQTWLPLAARRATLVNLGNSGPILHPRSLVVVHDVSVFRTPDNYTPRYVLAHRALGRALARTATVGTVSEFSRREIADVLPVRVDEVFVAGNGHEHMAGMAPDPSILGRLGIGGRPFFLFVGSPARNKNLQMAIAAHRRLAGVSELVLVGALPPSVFSAGQRLEEPGLVLAGRAGDAEVAALYAAAAALLFPSRYEGFGIPPLEAMVHRCPVLACDIPVVREVCGPAASYVPLDDDEALASAMRALLDDPGRREALIAAGLHRITNFSWRGSARRLADAILAASPAR